MIAVVFLLEPCECLVYAEVQTFGKQLHIGQHPRVQLIATDATNGRILVIHGDVEQVVQFAENAQLRELGDAREEHEFEIRVEHLDRVVKVLHCTAQGGQVRLLVHHIKQRSVILVDDKHHFLSRLLICLHHQVFQSYVGVLLLTFVAERAFDVIEHGGKITLKHVLVHVLRTAHVEMQHRMLHPVFSYSPMARPSNKSLRPS